MPAASFAMVCGQYCGKCDFFKKKECSGCDRVKGKPFWITQMRVDICPLYDCCINKKKLEHCGECLELPCETFRNFHDPALSKEKAEAEVCSRQQELMRRKELGTEAWLKEKI